MKTIADVRHVIVLMQENRSFDHYFGTLKGVRGFADRSTILIPGAYSVFDQPRGGGRQYPFALHGAGGADAKAGAHRQADLPHAWSPQHASWDHGRMDGWVGPSTPQVGTLGYLDRDDLPFYYALADAYTICDAYHCAAITATGPNRTFLWSGKIDAASRDGGDESGLTWQTYAEALEAAGVTWRVYQNADDNYGDNALAYFTQFASAPAGSPLRLHGMGSVPATQGSTTADILAAIKKDVIERSLPQVSWIVTDERTSEHPEHAPADGAVFVSGLLQALGASQDVLDATVIFLNYDENGGFFDHVPPPVPPEGTPGEFIDGVPIGLGFRVPLLVLSPWTRGGWVCSEVFDHTSVIRFMESWTTALGKPAICPNISAWRRSVSGDLTSAFDFTSPVPGLPPLPRAEPSPSGEPTEPEPMTNALPEQEPGTRPARALPYQPNASVTRWDFRSGDQILVWITMTNETHLARRASHFAVYANAHRGGGPWQYTVPPYDPATRADGSVSDYFNVGKGYGDGRYDLTVIGPNRFLRRLTGDATGAAKNMEVTSTYAVAPAEDALSIWFHMRNGSDGSAVFTIVSNQYRTDGPWTYAVAAGRTVDDHFNAVLYTNGWYDFTVTVDVDATWSRRFAGHLETGRPSVSG